MKQEWYAGYKEVQLSDSSLGIEFPMMVMYPTDQMEKEERLGPYLLETARYALACLEDCVLVVGDLATLNDTYNKYPQLESMANRMTVEIFGRVQEDFASFIASSPEERFKSLLDKRPGLIDRVPQHQLASYLGVAPESLSRIKKRISRP